MVTSFPLKAILHNSNATGNIAKWAAELAEFQLDFQPCHAVKSQVLAHYRKRLNFRGPRYFRRPAHENTDVIFVGP